MDWIYDYRSIYSNNENGELIAEVTFDYKNDDIINIEHTYVNPELRGKGIAGELIKTVLNYAREKGLKVTASCSYANLWIKKNINEYRDTVSDDIYKQEVSCPIDENH